MKLRLIQKIKEANSIKTFVFEKPENFNFLPGQFTYLTLPRLKYPDKRGNTRVFTISSSPTEKNLKITTKIRKESGFKRTLDETKTGEAFEFRKPMGEFSVFKKTKIKYIFLAGGIGITPFRSILRYHQDKKIKNEIHLIWSVKKESEIPFREEFNIWQKEKIAKIDITLTEETPNKWRGLLGRIDKDKLGKLIPQENLKRSKFMICGPPSFVIAMEEILKELKVKEESIVSEKFSGY